MANDLTRIRLIRHAHVDTGPAPGRLCGSLDLPLSAKGWNQIQLLRSHNGITPPPAALYTSPLIRARDTACALAEIWKLAPQIDTDLSEIHCGRVEGIEIAELERDHPMLWARNQAQDDDDFTWPGGESYRQFRERVLAGVRRIVQRHPGEEIVIVTHTGVITQIVGTIVGQPAAAWKHHRAEPLSATDIVWAEGSPRSVLGFGQRDWW